jgi:conjugal transfer/type IV secretion protein DotA/TraY
VIGRVRLVDGLSASDGGPFGEMFSLFNGFLLFLLGVVVFVKLVAALLDTAHEGEALGQDRSTTWTPIRIVLSASMLIPLVNGYSFIQVIVLWVTLSGVRISLMTATHFTGRWPVISAEGGTPVQGWEPAVGAQRRGSVSVTAPRWGWSRGLVVFAWTLR